MSSASGLNSDPDPQDPYSVLGLKPGASFDEVRQAKEKCLIEAGEDTMKKARIEASYDSVLMLSLKERQLGKLSNEAASASKREDQQLAASSGPKDSNVLLAPLKKINSFKNEVDSGGLWPEFSLPEGIGLTLRLALGAFALLLILVAAPGTTELILSVCTIGLFLSQIRRGRRALQSLGWSVVFLSTGLILGNIILNTSSNSILETSLSSDQIQAIPAIIVMWIGALFLA